MMMRSLAFLVAIAWILTLAGCGGHDRKKKVFAEERGVIPGCAISVLAAPPVAGDVRVEITITSLVAVSTNFDFSTDGGLTWTLASAASASPLANPANGIQPSAIDHFIWDTAADLPGVRALATRLRFMATPAGQCEAMLIIDNAHEPSCFLVASAADPQSALVTIDVFTIDPESDAARATVGWSTDGGATYLPAHLESVSGAGTLVPFTPTDSANPFAPGSNQVTGLDAGSSSALTWNAGAAGVGLMARTPVRLSLWIEDGSTAGRGPFSRCELDLVVLANDAPSCVIVSPTSGALTGAVVVEFDLADLEGDSSAIDFAYSTDQGASFTRASAAPASVLPSPAMAAPGRHTFTWDADSDLGSATGVAVRFRVQASDGIDVGATRPVACTTSFAWGATPIETLLALRALDGARELDLVVALAAGGAPALLFDVGDSIRPVIEAELALAGAIDVTDAVNSHGTTVHQSADPAIVTVATDGTLIAMGANACTQITATFTPDPIAIPTGSPIAISYAACCDLAGVDMATRTSGGRLAVGELDADLPGLPSGPTPGGVGSRFALVLHVSTGAATLAAHSLSLEYDPARIGIDSAAPGSIQGVFGSSTSYGGPTSVNDSVPGVLAFNHFRVGPSASGVFDIATVALVVSSAGTSTLRLQVGALGDASAMPIGAPGPRIALAATGSVTFP